VSCVDKLLIRLESQTEADGGRGRGGGAMAAAGAGDEAGLDLPHLNAERWEKVQWALLVSDLCRVPPWAPAGQREARATACVRAPRSPN